MVGLALGADFGGNLTAVGGAPIPGAGDSRLWVFWPCLPLDSSDPATLPTASYLGTQQRPHARTRNQRRADCPNGVDRSLLYRHPDLLDQVHTAAATPLVPITRYG